MDNHRKYYGNYKLKKKTWTDDVGGMLSKSVGDN
jgi:hypothetical protein